VARAKQNESCSGDIRAESNFVKKGRCPSRVGGGKSRCQRGTNPGTESSPPNFLLGGEPAAVTEKELREGGGSNFGRGRDRREERDLNEKIRKEHSFHSAGPGRSEYDPVSSGGGPYMIGATSETV